MCGIGGIFHRGGGEVSEARLLRMREAMAERGPDDAGIYRAPGIGLVHRRLSILDLSPAGRQPMANEDGTVWVVFNGEVYNFPQLRRELEERGHRFHSHSDTEVLVHGYEEWGLGLLQRIFGMFACGLWDGRKRRLLLARDRVGKKPLFWAEHGGEVLFASTLRALREGLAFTPEVDLAALDCFLTYSYIPAPHTIFQGVHKLPAAHFALFEEGRTRIERYWHLSFARQRHRPTEEWLEELDFLLREAVRRRLLSDVPLGALLSGGVDSSLVVALMAQCAGEPVRTFTITSEDPRLNEAPYARRVAERWGTLHTELRLGEVSLDVLPRILWHYGEPFADPSALPSYFVSRLARQHVTVVLNGDGGDEAFGGYSRYSGLWWLEHLRRTMPIGMRKGLAAWGRDPRRRGSRWLQALALPLEERYARHTAWLDWREALYTPSFRKQLEDHHPQHVHRDLLALADGPTELDRAFFVDFGTWLPDGLLTKMDVASMAHALEARSPLLDTSVLEFAASIPASQKLPWGQPKFLLKRLAERYVPREVLYRRKGGFLVPVGPWLRERGPWLRKLLLSPTALGRGLFRPETVEQVLEAYLRGERHHERRVWTLLCWELWCRLFLEGTLSPEEPLDAVEGRE